MITGRFLCRRNRFVVECVTESGWTTAYLANAGRLWELLQPGAELLLSQSPAGAKHPYRVRAVDSDEGPVPLDTTAVNDTVHGLLSSARLPGLEGYRVKAREVSRGRNRFDFLLEGPSGSTLLEVKSCTLASRRVAMFGDAVSERARRHLLALAQSEEECGVLFLVHRPGREWFYPDFHTDLELGRVFLQVRDRLPLYCYSVGYDQELRVVGQPRPMRINWNLLEQEARDGGAYLVLLRLDREARVRDFDLGAGYYAYVGSARRGLDKRLARHRRKRKRFHWHIDYLREQAEFVQAIPIRSSQDLECRLAASTEEVADWSVRGFGCSDCSCQSHLFGFGDHPLQLSRFTELLLEYRLGRLGLT